MKIENQVTSLELSNRLKKAGAKQESLFYWAGFGEPVDKCEKCGRDGNFTITTYEPKSYLVVGGIRLGDWISAFTVSELEQMLPDGFYTVKNLYDIYICVPTREYKEQYPQLEQSIGGATEVSARGKMLAFLLEEKIIVDKQTKE